MRRTTLAWLALAGALLAAFWTSSALAQAPSGYGVETIDPGEIKEGMKGFGYSVFQGTEPKRFEVEVLGVVPGAISDMEMILCRMSGQNLEFSGIVAGMSGSPIYIEGKLAGALAYGWSYPKEPIAGITPIKYMLELLKEPADLPAESYRPAMEWREGGEGAIWRKPAPMAPLSRMPEAAGIQGLPAEGGLVPLASPVALGGFGPAAAGRLNETLSSFGLEAMAGVAGGANLQDEDVPLVAGGGISVPLMSGDFSATVTGTITWRGGDDILAFGHPFLGSGNVRMPMGGAYIHHIMSQLNRSFKMSTGTKVEGAIVMDRLPAIRGDKTATADMIDARIDLRNISAGTVRQFNFQVVRHDMFGPIMIGSALGDALDKGGALSTEAARAKASVDLEFEDAEPLHFENVYAYEGSMSSMDVVDRMVEAMTNPFKKTHLKSFHADIEVENGRFGAQLTNIRVLNDKIVPGGSLEAEAHLELYNRDAITKRISIDIPERFRPGVYHLLVHGGNNLGTPFQSDPQNYEQLVERLNGWLPNNSLVIVVTGQIKEGVAVGGNDLMELPDSVRGAIVRSADVDKSPIFNEIHDVIPTDLVISGSADMDVKIEEE